MSQIICRDKEVFTICIHIPALDIEEVAIGIDLFLGIIIGFLGK